ncbi:hypothetical protein niasHT_030427 [Heterodera trifolii]|uniref:Uncharacterized protein n=1 Tax=Heterodera trifolii TaxID=157864 RepID=A0ABD2IE42_9BILA
MTPVVLSPLIFSSIILTPITMAPFILSPDFESGHLNSANNGTPFLTSDHSVPAGVDPGHSAPDSDVTHCALPVRAKPANVFSQIAGRSFPLPLRTFTRFQVASFRLLQGSHSSLDAKDVLGI